MPKIPRDIDGKTLAKLLRKFGYTVYRQTGSHMRLFRESGKEVHHLTIPAHSPLKIGTLNSILDDVSIKLGIAKNELIKSLFG